MLEHCCGMHLGQAALVMMNRAKDQLLLQNCKCLGIDALCHKATEIDCLVAYCARLATQDPDSVASR